MQEIFHGKNTQKKIFIIPADFEFKLIMNSLSKIVGKFSKQNICVIGDLMADYYIFGDTNRFLRKLLCP